MTCGVCLRDNVDVINIFGEEGRRLEISAIIRQHFWFEPIEDDTILSRICSECWEQIANFHVFYTNVKNAHKKLSERYYANQQYTGECYDYYQEQPDPNVYNGEQNCDYNYEDTGEDIGDNNDIPNDSEIYFKQEQTVVESSSYAENTYDENYYQEESETADNPHTTNDEIQEEDESLLERGTYRSPEIFEDNAAQYGMEPDWQLEPSEPRPKNKSVKKSTKRGKNTENESVEDKLVSRDSLSFKRDPRNRGVNNRKDENKLKEEDDLIAKHIKLDCEVCQENFPRFYDLVRHYQSAHNISGYARCCDKKLPSRAYVLDHINKHINPDSYKCKECNKIFSSQYAIKNHLAIKHAPETDKIFVCDFCPEKFSNQHALNQHCTRHISEEEKRTYCIDCRKTFPTPLALQMHKNVYHGQLQGHICHVCGKIVRGKAIFAKHVNEHAAELGQETINDPVCPICGKLSASIKTLRHHIRYVHSSHRPHKCTVCGKAFKIRQKLKEHMGSHAVGNPFPCPYCHKRFRSKLHLYSHKYRMHKQEYEEEKQIRFKMMTESFRNPELSYENTSMSENDVQQYDDSSIVLSEDSSPDDCYVVA